MRGDTHKRSPAKRRNRPMHQPALPARSRLAISTISFQMAAVPIGQPVHVRVSMRYRLGRRRAPTRVTRRTATLISTCCYQALRRRVRVGVASPRLRNERVTSSEFRSAVLFRFCSGLAGGARARHKTTPGIRAGRWLVIPSGGPSPLSQAGKWQPGHCAGAAPREARPRLGLGRWHWQWHACSGVLHCHGMPAGAARSTLPGSPRRPATWRGSASTPARGPACRPAGQQLLLATRLKETSERLS